MKLLHQIALQDETHRRFKAWAAMRGMSMTELVIKLIEDEIALVGQAQLQEVSVVKEGPRPDWKIQEVKE